MVVKAFNNEVLEGLCSKDQLDLLDSVDRLRSQGIDHYVSLPQIIVCGDQSSGKSSVLEAISGVSFPVKSNLCTRFPTELILRKTPNVGVTVSIVPHHSHTASEHASLSNFREVLDGFDKLPDLIEKAKTAMAIGSFARAFSKDLLRVEVSGPDRPHLTIVDLPGLIHSETKQQSAADVELVQDVVRSYMKEPRSVILAVVSAKNDYANQIVLKLARTADKTGTRTLGVITKPDTLIPRSESEQMYISLAQNHDVEFRLGWHVLKNMDSETGTWSLSKRDENERHFFSEGIWPTLPQSILGIAVLRERLSKLLLAQIAAELPSLVDEIERKSSACRTQLRKLGQPRASVEEQRLYLLTLSQTCQSLIKSAIDGTYNNHFFGDAKTDTGYQKRIRAVVQNLNQAFAERIAREGHCYSITETPITMASNIGSLKVKSLSRAVFLKHIDDLMMRTRGRELPGTFNPMIISDLFLEQSESWEVLAQSHVDEVARAVKTFLNHLISHIADNSTSGPLFRILIEPALEQIVKDLKSKTADLLAPHQRGHPITHNQDFTETVQKVRTERRRIQFTCVIQDFFCIQSLETSVSRCHDTVNYTGLLNALMARDDNERACSEALDCMQAYYEVALKRFVDDIAVEAVETNIIANLNDILSPIQVISLATDMVTEVAGESEESRAKRKQLVNQLDVLMQGSETCKRFMVWRLQGRRDMTIRQEISGVASTSVSLSPSSMSVHTGSDELLDDEIPDDVDLSAIIMSDDPISEPVEAVEEAVEERLAELVVEQPLAGDQWGALASVKKKKGKKAKPSFDFTS